MSDIIQNMSDIFFSYSQEGVWVYRQNRETRFITACIPDILRNMRKNS